MLRTADLFDVQHLDPTLSSLLRPERPWQVLEELDALMATIVPSLQGIVHPSAIVEGAVMLAAGACIGPHAWVQGPAWIGEGAEVGHGALVRGGCVLGADARVGHASEIKRSVLLPGARAPHFNYVGDSVIGTNVNLGAGVKLANFKTDGSTIAVADQATGLRKFGAALGDGVSVGCNAVLAPGTVVGARTMIYAGALVRGEIAGDAIVKHRPVIEVAERR